jgi:molybdenum cofactor biosynthesis protein B
MSVADHRSTSPATVSCFVLTVSDSRTLETETSGKAIAELLTAAGHTVVDRLVVKDEPMRSGTSCRTEIERNRVKVIITTGRYRHHAAGFDVRGARGLFDKRLDGFGELFRMLSFEEIGSAAMMSRATAGIVGRCALFLLPGSEAAVRLAMSRLIIPELGHVARELNR